jgi:hypothetical protein
MRPLAQPALVGEDDGALLAAGFFSIRGQSTFFQCRIAC